MKNNSLFKYDMIDSPSQLHTFIQTVENENRIAVDLEADSLYHFNEKVCLIQMATLQRTVLIDPLQVKDLSPLKGLFSNHRIQKVFHGADYDIRSLYRDFHIEINHLFDTQIAAMFLGIKETGLDALLKDRFNVQLTKKYQKKDWSKRPLSDDMLAYAAMDVLYLLPLAEQLETLLRERNRLHWVKEEDDILSRVRPALSNGNPLYLKFKGAGRLAPRSLAVLEALLAFRIKIAKKKDKPLFKIFSNASLLKIALQMPSDLNALAKSGALSAKQVNMYGSGIIREVHRAVRIPEDNLPLYPRKKAPPRKRGLSKQVKMMKSWREKQADTIGLDPSLICNNALIHAIAYENPKDLADLGKIPGIRKWQIMEFGENILRSIKTNDRRKPRKITKG